MARHATGSTATVSKHQAAIGEQRLDSLARQAATAGCRDLLRAQLRAGQHNITDPDQFARACASVGLVGNATGLL